MDPDKDPGSNALRGDTHHELLGVRRLDNLSEPRHVRRIVCRDLRLADGATVSSLTPSLSDRGILLLALDEGDRVGLHDQFQSLYCFSISESMSSVTQITVQ